MKNVCSLKRWACQYLKRWTCHYLKRWACQSLKRWTYQSLKRWACQSLKRWAWQSLKRWACQSLCLSVLKEVGMSVLKEVGLSVLKEVGLSVIQKLILPILKCCLIMNYNVWFERFCFYLFFPVWSDDPCVSSVTWPWLCHFHLWPVQQVTNRPITQGHFTSLHVWPSLEMWLNKTLCLGCTRFSGQWVYPTSPHILSIDLTQLITHQLCH